jgi:hypothetical protein
MGGVEKFIFRAEINSYPLKQLFFTVDLFTSAAGITFASANKSSAQVVELVDTPA